MVLGIYDLLYIKSNEVRQSTKNHLLPIDCSYYNTYLIRYIGYIALSA